jgi:soluble lytic murein transglycosylase
MYYRQMLDKFDGHFALAAAAYNAGPHNVDK